MEQTIEKSESIEDCVQKEIILFVCTGNTCRSPMASALLNDMATKGPLVLRGPDSVRPLGKIEAVSAGLSVFPGMPISDEAVRALETRGILSTQQNPYKLHRARAVDEAMMRRADVVIGISKSHASALMLRFPECADKIFCMPEDIPDPYGCGDEIYLSCLDRMKQCLEQIFVPDRPQGD